MKRGQFIGDFRWTSSRSDLSKERRIRSLLDLPWLYSSAKHLPNRLRRIFSLNMIDQPSRRRTALRNWLFVYLSSKITSFEWQWASTSIDDAYQSRYQMDMDTLLYLRVDSDDSRWFDYLSSTFLSFSPCTTLVLSYPRSRRAMYK